MDGSTRRFLDRRGIPVRDVMVGGVWQVRDGTHLHARASGARLPQDLEAIVGLGAPMVWDALLINVNPPRWTSGKARMVTARSATVRKAVQATVASPAGKRADLPSGIKRRGRTRRPRRVAHPFGLIDCHTHLIYAGNRANEFEMRLAGASYQDIAKAGGGIVSTVNATRAASEDALVASGAARLHDLLAEGVTTIEIKSGYGLDTASEMKILRAARRLGRNKVEVKTTFLAAHALPPEYAGRPDDYITMVCEEMLPAVVAARLADAVDAFCEDIGFTPAQTARVFEAARQFRLPVKLHADQLSDSGGAALVAQYKGLSADHLEFVSEASLRAMAAAGTVAVLLPGAFYFLRETRKPPIDALRRHGVPMAIASDCNPRHPLHPRCSCSIWRTLFRTLAEALAA
jgi:imidazolonepropionase